MGRGLGTEASIYYPNRNNDVFLSIDQLKPGMVLATDVTDTNGRLLLSKGQPIAPKHLNIFKMWAVMDIAAAVDEFGDAGTVKMVARKLIENVDRQLQTIRESIAKGDREHVRKESHAIKGGAATMEAAALSAAAAHLEKLSPDGPVAELDAGFGDLEAQFYRFREFVSQWKGT